MSENPIINELIKHLTDYRQADEDGVMVLVSRQACDMAAQALREIQTENECLQEARDAMEWIKTDTRYKAPEQITVELFTTYITKLEGALEKKKEEPQEIPACGDPEYDDGAF